MLVGGLDGLAEVHARLAKTHTVLGPPPQLCQKLLQPSFLSDLAARSGLRFPPTTDAIDPIRSSPGLGWLIKSPAGSGGLGVRWGDRADASGRIEPGQYFQRWIAGRCFGASFLCDGRDAWLLGACRSAWTRTGPTPFVYAGSYGPSKLSVQTTKALKRLGTLLAGQGMRGLFNADIVLDRSGKAWLLEVNPRWSGSSELVERFMRDRGVIADGQSLLGLAHSACHQSLDFPPRWSDIRQAADADEKNVAGGFYWKRVVFARHDFHWRAEMLDRSIMDMMELSRAGMEIEVLDRPPAGSRILKGQPIVTLLGNVPSARANRGHHWSRQMRFAVATVHRQTARKLPGPVRQVACGETIKNADADGASARY
ncbi:MAG: ATP-grasp domain-containing protein [Pirellulales bacterium]|nr:ATP-grasp domain-containing protein [Pirellulales bacterium]